MMPSVKELIQKCVQNEMPGLEIGVVTDTDPLRITLEDDAKINLSTASLVIPSRHEPLNEGDRLYMLAINRNKIYYVLDRV